MSVQISQGMFSEIMPAFTEMAEMFMMKSKSSEKRALFQMLSWCVFNRRQNRELENHQEKKNTSVDEKETDEAKLHAALVLLSGQFTNLEGIHSAVDVARVSTTE